MPEIIPNTVRVRLLGTVAGQGAQNTIHAIAPGGFVVNQTTANTLGAALKAAWTSNLGAVMHTTASLVRVGLRDMRTPNAAEYLDAGAAVVGSAAGEALPAQVALCLTLRTAKSGKSFRGRVYVGGFAEADNVPGGVASAAANTAITSWGTGISGAMTASGLTFAVASRPSEAYVENRTTTHNDGTTTVKVIGRGIARPGEANAVTIIQSRGAAWETQRRRNNGRGAVPTVFVGALEAHL